MTRTFWILQEPSGKFTMLVGEYLSHTADPMQAMSFQSLRDARSYHDSRGHFYGVEMHAVKVTVKIDVALDGKHRLPARDHSSGYEDGEDG